MFEKLFSRICFINQTVYTCITDCMIIINHTCGHNVFMHCTGVILVEIVVTVVGYCIQAYCTSLFILTMEVMSNNQVTAWMIM